MKIFWLVVLVWVTYFKSLGNKHISDDLTTFHLAKTRNFAIRWRDLIDCPNKFFDEFIWKVCKGNTKLQHAISITIFSGLVVSIYLTLQKFLPENVAYLSTIIFVVHPCNAQVAGWFSGKPYALTCLIAVLAIYFNSFILYICSGLVAVSMLPAVLFLKTSILVKALGICIFLWFISRNLSQKEGLAKTEDAFKKENFRIYPRKLVVAVKSFAYYFCLALFPIKMGWFHEIGEPIDEKIKQLNTHFWLGILLIIALFTHLGSPQWLGLLIFGVFIAQFTNILTLGLFTAERYMTGALIGTSVFCAYLLVSYPIIATVLITLYFARTQLELWAYRDDFTLALYSLLNFEKSGFAWCNIAHIFMATGKPHGAFDLLLETKKRLPEFPTTYYMLHQIYRCTDLMNNMDLALENLENACFYGQHSKWFAELEQFKQALKKERVERFLKNVARNTTTRYIQPPVEQLVEANRAECVGVTANS